MQKNELPAPFQQIIQSWDTANNPREAQRLQRLHDLGHLKDKKIYLLHLPRYPLG